jgi:hypothetical protein
MALCRVTGNIKAILGLIPGLTFTSGTIRFMLVVLPRQNQVPTIAGTGQLASEQVDFPLNFDGSFVANVQGNDTISPMGTLYQVMFLVPNISMMPLFYGLTGASVNLNVAPPVPAPVLNDSGTIFSDAEVPVGVIDGVNQTFMLLFSPATSASLLLFKNGVLQTGGGVDYNLTGNKIVYASAPSVGDAHIAWYRHG